MDTVVLKLLRFYVGNSSVLIATLALLTTLVWVNAANAQATTTLKGVVEPNVNPGASEIPPRALSAPDLHKYRSSDERLTLPATAQPSNTVFRTFGIDGMSCAYWLASPVQARDGRAWILGYWAANNRLNAKNHHVGARSNTETILGSVEDICETRGWMSLSDATSLIYGRFQSDGK